MKTIFEPNKTTVNRPQLINITTGDDFAVITDGGIGAVHVNKPPGSGTSVGRFGQGCVYSNHEMKLKCISK